MALGLKGGREFTTRFMGHLKLVTIETHVADCYTCILHPASHTHRQLTDEQLRAADIDPDLIRLSVGLEDPEDLIADIAAALDAAAE
jgi:O-acetylhomoserine (thiol)-lyase